MDVRQLRRSDSRVMFRPPVHDCPGDHPGKSQRTRHQKANLPAIAQGKPGNHEGGDQRADVGAGIEDSGGKGALFLGKPFRDGLDGSRKVAGLSQSEADASRNKSRDRAHPRVRHGGDAPEDDRERKSTAAFQPVDHATHKDEADPIGQLKPEDDVAVIDLVPAQFGGEGGFENSENLAIDVVDGGGEEQQRANPPAIAAYSTQASCGRLGASAREQRAGSIMGPLRIFHSGYSAGRIGKS